MVLLRKHRAELGSYISDRMLSLLAEQEREEELGELADLGSRAASNVLVTHLTGHGRDDDAVAILRQRADSCDGFAADRLAALLARTGRVGELRERADAGSVPAFHQLIAFLLDNDMIDEALDRLRDRADNGDCNAAIQLIGLLAEHDRLDELAAEVTAGTVGAATLHAELHTT